MLLDNLFEMKILLEMKIKFFHNVSCNIFPRTLCLHRMCLTWMAQESTWRGRALGPLQTRGEHTWEKTHLHISEHALEENPMISCQPFDKRSQKKKQTTGTKYSH